jgi:hypothetical protein
MRHTGGPPSRALSMVFQTYGLEARFWNNFQFADNPGVDIATSGLSQVDYGA